MKIRFLVPLLGLCLLGSCSRREPEEFSALGAVTTSGAPGGHYAIRAYKYQKGDRIAVAGILERPGQGGAGPAFVMLYRLPNRDEPSFSVKSSSGGGGGLVSFEQSFTVAGGNVCAVEYELKGEPVTEHWSINKKPYTVDAGRVVLVDMTKNPAEITQVQADLTGVFSTIELNQQKMKADLDKLREQNEAARRFLDHSR
jgi:hypothetical protein